MGCSYENPVPKRRSDHHIPVIPAYSTELHSNLLRQFERGPVSTGAQLSLRKVVTDYFVVLSGSSQRQIGSLVEDIEQELKEVGVTLHHREGSTGSSWRLLDYGDLVVHIFEPSERNFYDIEGMWSKAHEVVRVQ